MARSRPDNYENQSDRTHEICHNVRYPAPPVHGDTVANIVRKSRWSSGETDVGAVEHLKTLCSLGLTPGSAMVAVVPLLHEIIPHGWTRIWQMAPDASITGGYTENPAALHIYREHLWRFMDD